MSRFLTTAGEQVAGLAEQAAEEGRLSRGRALFRKGSVSGLSVSDGSVTASVRGSEGDPYDTTISTTPAPPGIRRQIAERPEGRRSVDALIEDGVDICPREIDLAFVCDCPDWDEPCKHVVAVLLAFADRVDLDEAELLRWRSIDPSAMASTSASTGPDAPSPPRPKGSSRASARPRTVRPAAATDDAAATEGTETVGGGDRTARLSELKSLLGDTAMRVSDDGGSAAEPAPSVLEPALAEFLGLDAELEPVDVTGITAVTPLFTGVELGPLADLGPELATALAIIADRLSSPN